MGLATIAILSTMVLVTLVGGVNIYIGGKDYIERQNPHDFEMEFGPVFTEEAGDQASVESSAIRPDSQKVIADLAQTISTQVDLPDKKETSYIYRYRFLNEATSSQFTSADDAQYNVDESLAGVVYVFSEADYQEMTGKSLQLDQGQALIYGRGLDFQPGQEVRFDQKTITIKEVTPVAFAEKKLPLMASLLADKMIFLVVPDVSQYLGLEDEYYYYGFDTSLSQPKQIDFIDSFFYKVTGELDKSHLYMRATSIAVRARNEAEFYAISGSIFFIGILLPFIFTVATVLVIYYKQISEAFEDRDRFVIMHKVGLDEKETKRSIRKQMMTVFFLPVIVAVVHLAFAFKMLTSILRKMIAVNDQLLLTVTMATAGTYFVTYIVVYFLTSRSYHRIIRQ